jgi:integrase
MGSLSERTPGTWLLRVHAGRNRYVNRTVRGTRAQAVKALARLEVEVEDHAVGHGAGTFGQFAETWWATKSWRSPRSRQTAREDLDRYLLPAFGSKALARLGHEHIDALYQALLAGEGTKRGKPLAPGSVARMHRTLHACLEWGVRKGRLGRNPAARASPPSDPPTKVVPPERAEVAKLIAEAAPPLDFFVALAAGTGRRRGDLLALRVGDLDLGEAPSMAVSMDKNRRSVRLSLPASVAQLARAHLACLERDVGTLGRRVGPRSFVFSDDGGATAWLPRSTSRRFERLTERCGLDLNLHALRHFHATELLGAGVDVETVAMRLGDNPQQILKTYSHFRPARDAAVAALWDRIMEG